MINIIKLNDLDIKNFLCIIISLQLVLWVTVFLDSNTSSLFFRLLRNIIMLLYLLYAPGILLLRILGMHNLGTIKTGAYSLGISIFFVMFTGFFINIIYPFFSDAKPLSFMNLMFTFTILIILLSVLAYFRDKSFINHPNSNPLHLSPSVFFIFLLPFLSVISAYVMNNYDNNFFSMLLLMSISFIIVLVALNKIPKSFYPLTIFLTSISILLSCSLISNNLWGWDIQIEYFFANSVASTSIWNYMIPDNTNSMLSITILAPILRIMSNLNLVWIFKIIYPSIFSIVPVVLYEVFRKQTNEKIAVFSAFFFIFFYSFFIELLQIGKQMIAEFFIVIFLLLLMDTKINNYNKSILLLIFTAAIVVSHYGTSYIYLLLLLLFIFLTYVFKYLNIKLQDLNIKYISTNIFENYKNTHFSLTFIIFFLVFAFSWYIYISDSSALWTITKIGNHVISNLYDFLNPDSVQGLSYIASSKNSILREIAKYVQLISQFFIVFGFFIVFFSKEKYEFSDDYNILSFAALIILFIGITIPFFGSAMNTSRLYQLMLIVLSPFCVIGGSKLFKLLSSSININFSSSKFFALFLIIFFIFNTGFVYEIVGDQSQMVSINTEIKDHYPIFSDEDLYGVKWLMRSTDKPHNNNYADRYNTLLFYQFGARTTYFPYDAQKLKPYYYCFFGTSNVINQKIPYINKTTTTKHDINMKDSSLIFDDYTTGTKIYDNGGSQVYYT